ncbi:MAG: amidase [Phaeodactylibacter sp.]|nr:amidase [Phaeodactylibacter sp.]MCB9302546.1 amidase [Lewinellaceae bacterium]
MKKRNILTLLLGLTIGVLLGFTLLRGPIDRGMVEQAAALIGLEMTPAEVDSMLPGLEEQQTAYQSIREQDIPNGLTPALLFNPLPQGFEVPSDEEAIAFNLPKYVKLPENREELAFFSVAELSALIKSRQISSVELTKFFLERLKKYDPGLHCVITLTEERALAQAKQMDEELGRGFYRGPLHGIPYGAKDLLAADGYKTTWGAMPYKDQMLNYDAAVIEKLDAAGAVLIAKLSMGALAWGDVWYGGKTRNPWNTEQGSSGSSAGSASAVSAGLAPFAIGTETWGSIVSPATVCGVTGLRPTFGRVSRYGAMALSWSMDKIGPICRTAEDCAIVFEAIRGKDQRDPTTVDAAFNYNHKLEAKQLRVAYLKKDFEGDYGFKANDSLALAKLRQLGIVLVPIELPEVPDISFILSAEAAAAFDELTRSGKDDLLVRQIRNAWPNSFRQSRFIPAVEYIQANRLRTAMIEEIHKRLKEVDVFIAPSWSGDNLLRTNLSGHPCVVLPTGFRDGTPTSITFCGQLYGEAAILKLAAFFQANTAFHLKHPEGF